MTALPHRGRRRRRTEVSAAVATGLLAVLLTACGSPPPPTAADAAALTAARDRLSRCVVSRLSTTAGVTPAAARALARSLTIACRTEQDAFEATALTILGEDAAEAEVAAMEAWIFRLAEDRTFGESSGRRAY